MSLDISDPEKNLKTGASESPASPDNEGPKGPWTSRVIDSFKRDPNASITKAEVTAASRGHFDHKTAAENTANSGLVQKLQSRHMQMIAIGGSIGTFLSCVLLWLLSLLACERSISGSVQRVLTSLGTGLFVTSGKALATGGPASLVIAFCIIGILMFCTVQALGELAVLFPVAGSFSAYSTRFLDPAWGFAMGWK
jgi:amino acid transporter